jgi:formyl-CoA transferase
VHIEQPGSGDAARSMGPQKDGEPLWWKVSGRNKHSVALDLGHPEGRQVARQLAREADVVIASLRPSTLTKWGLDYESLHALNRKLVMLQISGYGAKSSRRDDPGFGKVGEARSGVVHLTGFPDSPPVHTGFSHGDAVTGLMGAFAIMSALYRRAYDPGFDGEWIDLALFESLYRLIEWQVIVHDQLGGVPQREGNRLAVAPAAVVNTYLTADEEWVTVTSATQRSVLNVVRLLGLDAADYATVADQAARRDELDAHLRAWMSQRRTEEALRDLAEAEVVASRIFSVADIVADPVYEELGDIVQVEDPQLGPVRMQGVIPRLERHPGEVWRTGAALGEDNREVLSRWLGLAEERIRALRELGVIADPPPRAREDARAA